MEEKKEKNKMWIKEHKVELIVTGIGISAVIALVLGVKHYGVLQERSHELKKLMEKVPESISAVEIYDSAKEFVSIEIKETLTRAPHDVRGHVRELPTGQNASAKQLAIAAKYGCVLRPGQTFVEAYRTGGNVA